MNAKIIYGTAWKKERTTALVLSAVLAGFRAIDTACQPKHYREDLVGEALQILYDKHGYKREELFLQTKFTPIGGQDTSRPLPYDPSSSIEAQIRSSFFTSLQQLRTTYLDSYILHSPLETYAKTLEAWRVLVSFQDEDRVRVIGLSNAYDADLLARLGKDSGRAVQVVQNRWYERNGWNREVVAWCHANGAQYQSFWTLTGSPNLLSHPATIAIAKANECTPPQAVYYFAQSLGITPLSGTTAESHMQEDVTVENLNKGREFFSALTEFIWG
ncbi:Aldo/keto reductase [Multifurca ochricompacta]|uniref:Aldo/keto reductase n=1 Tax=Multifurca ochricompacta TaxID=376703 RepID=A0AAD4M865_9AGAM|nr:Aldo/keto reductase [Multifurca ochricompacta]